MRILAVSNLIDGKVSDSYKMYKKPRIISLYGYELNTMLRIVVTGCSLQFRLAVEKYTIFALSMFFHHTIFFRFSPSTFGGLYGTVHLSLATLFSYIKEFVHGDFGRTKPNIGSLLNRTADILELDVEVSSSLFICPGN